MKNGEELEHWYQVYTTDAALELFGLMGVMLGFSVVLLIVHWLYFSWDDRRAKREGREPVDTEWTQIKRTVNEKEEVNR